MTAIKFKFYLEISDLNNNQFTITRDVCLFVLFCSLILFMKVNHHLKRQYTTYNKVFD